MVSDGKRTSVEVEESHKLQERLTQKICKLDRNKFRLKIMVLL